VQADQQGFAGDTWECDADGVWKSVSFAAVDSYGIAAVPQQLLQVVSQCSRRLLTFDVFRVPELQRFGHTDDQGNGFRSRSLTAFLMAAVQQRRQSQAASEQQPADTSRAMKFVGGEGQCGRSGTAKTDWYLTHSLNGIQQQRDML